MRTQPNVEMSFQSTTPNGSTPQANCKKQRLLVEGLGVGGGGRNVGVTGSLVRAGGELELVGSLEASRVAR
jgi:hypothetical protein